MQSGTARAREPRQHFVGRLTSPSTLPVCRPWAGFDPLLDELPLQLMKHSIYVQIGGPLACAGLRITNLHIANGAKQMHGVLRM